MIEEKLKILQNAFGEPWAHGPERLYHCPKCVSNKKKLSVNLDKNVFKCWVCDFSGKNINFLVKKFSTTKDYLSWMELSGVDMSSAPSDVENIFRITSVEPAEILKLPKEFRPINTKRFPATKKAYQYLLQRGLGKTEIRKWKIGYCATGPYKYRIVIPSFDSDGELNYFVSRTIFNNAMKYKNPKTSKDIIFNDLMINWAEPIVLVEGVFDSFKMNNSIPILGSTFGDDSVLLRKIVRNNSKVYIALDSDAYDKSLQIYKMLSKYGIKTKILVLDGKQDLGDMSKNKVSELYNSATDIDSNNYLLYEIMKI